MYGEGIFKNKIFEINASIVVIKSWDESGERRRSRATGPRFSSHSARWRAVATQLQA